MSPFSYAQTHGITRRPGSHVRYSSADLDWTMLFVSVQEATSFEGYQSGVEDDLIVIPLRQAVRLERQIGGSSQRELLPAGSITITPGSADFSMRSWSDHGSFETLHLYVRHTLLEEVYGEMFAVAGRLVLSACIAVIDPLILGIAYELQRMLTTPDESDRFYLETLSRSLAGSLIRKYASDRPACYKPVQPAPTRHLRRALDFIETSLDDSLHLTDIAKAAGLNSNRLAMEFKSYLNLTPYGYVMKARVDRARRLLTSTDLRLAEIASQCGFSHQQHMTSMVRRHTGLTPGALRASG